MTRPALYVLAALLVAGCGNHDATSGTAEPLHASPPDAATATSRSPATIPDRSCGPARDLIVWIRTDGGTPNAQLLGAYQIADCTPTLDYLRTVSPTGPGDCTIAAWASDNPRYDVNAPSPRRPRKPVEEIGGGC